jgi:UDP-N-acetylglucosamine 2-epimerase (non-hydrolysing)
VLSELNHSSILIIIGTRPEAIKMWPVVQAFKKYSTNEVKVCLTAQHRQLLDQFVKELQIPVHVDLDLMTPEQSLENLSIRLIPEIGSVFRSIKPNLVLVQGDTTSAALSAFVSFYAKIPVGHVEAGLRTDNRFRPFPEEMNRRMLADLCDLHFAPTESAKQNLLAEGVDIEHIFVTGNTVIDTVRHFAQKTPQCEKPTILMTVHRRESFGEPIRNIFQAVKKLAGHHPELTITFPVHPNPQVLKPANEIIGHISNIKLVEPMPYLAFISAMQSAWFILSDSGGVQEEATALGRPVLLLRSETERPEAVLAGNVVSVGANIDAIFHASEALIRDEKLRNQMSRVSYVYGNGTAGEHIARICMTFLKKKHLWNNQR